MRDPTLPPQTPSAVEPPAPTVELEPTAPAPTAEPDPAAPEIETTPIAAPTMLSAAALWRESKSRVEISGIAFGLRPTAGEAVTVLPRHPTLPALELSITKVKTHGNPRDDIPRWWEPVLEEVTEPAWVDVRAAVDVVVVYPATPSATLLDPTRILPDDLPPSVLPKGVEIAVDVDGDGRPDAIEASVCSENPRRARCFEATAWEIHRREGDGWQLVHRFEPAT
ncbi:hypothetical protein [Paraliomyxa miuraensis]|uniref:hypothetical protein n=1 Tax=Paraliomyxa miuraensis TaxID=376150 RepID=UPI002250822A|nr:hypothetical protein [Paraliomyxa miuraensis]MCX4240483.1 hypothetical protein [Paraliomyxa miuraensis]